MYRRIVLLAQRRVQGGPPLAHIDRLAAKQPLELPRQLRRLAQRHQRAQRDLIEALGQVNESPEVDYLYLVDSYGAFYSEQVSAYLAMYREHAPDKPLGFHGHNNQQLAFSNTQQAIIEGVNLLDATINGIGRGAGNCNLELLLNFLKNPKFDVRPVYRAIQEQLVPLREEIEWGFNDIYGISGYLNQHPRDAMRVRGNNGERDRCYDFFLEQSGESDSGMD